MTIFNTLASKNTNGMFGSYDIERSSELGSAIEFVSFPTPRDVLVSRWYPGYRATDLTGVSADEALALTLGASIETPEDLQSLQRTLATPDIASEVIAQLLPRSGIVVKGRTYQMSEEQVVAVVREVLSRRVPGLADAVAMAYTHSIVRVLAAKGLVLTNVEAKVVSTASSYTVTAENLRKIILVESLRGVFSEARISAVTRTLDQDATPAIFGDQLGLMFRDFSRAIPEIHLRLKQLDSVTRVVHMMHVCPEDVPAELKAHASLQALMSYANFVVYASETPLSLASMPGEAVEELRRACDSVLTAIQSAPSIESMPLAKYAEYFGETPVASPDGIRRGVVLYTTCGQASKLEVVDAWPRGAGYVMSQVDPAYVPAAAVSSPLTGTLLAVDAIRGLSNIVADEAASTQIEGEEGVFPTPKLLTIGVGVSDLVYLAMARASTVAYVRSSGPTSPEIAAERGTTLIYGCKVAEQWRMEVMAATSHMAYFSDPNAVIVYTSQMQHRDPKPFPTRSQIFGTSYGRDVVYFGSVVERSLERSVGETFSYKLTVQPYGREAVSLNMSINVLEMLVGPDSKPIPRGSAFYAVVAEPGVDETVGGLMKLALAYAGDDGPDILADKAKSWLVINLAPIMTHPAVRALAETTVNRAVIQAKLDGRSLRPQMRELYTRAFFGTALAVLNRFGKIDGATTAELNRVVPVSTLSMQAAITLAQVPAAINGDRT